MVGVAISEVLRVCGDKLCPVDQNPPEFWAILDGDGFLGNRMGYPGPIG